MQQISYVQTGKLRNRIKILDPTAGGNSVQDTFGGPSGGQGAPALVANTWASIEFLGTTTLTSVQQASAQVTHKVTLRWMPGIRGAQQVYFVDGEGLPRLLQIRAVDNQDERRRVLILECLERPDLLAQIETIPN